MSTFPIKNRYFGFVPAIIWAGAISLLSTDTFSADHTGKLLYGFFPLDDGNFSILHMLIRKAAHISEYAVLGWLTVRALFKYDGTLSRFTNLGRLVLFACLIGCLYASLDEVHQAFVPSRTASIKDVLFDSLGFCLGAIARSHWLRQTKQYPICQLKSQLFP